MLKESIDVMLPFIMEMCNASMSEGLLPISQRHAIVTPLIKKTSLNPGECKNYRPVSNLTFMSKVVERLVSSQLVDYLQSNDLMPKLQSAYRRHHSTETALLRVISDILDGMEKGRITLLGLLDLSAAFDTVDHSILLNRLAVTFGIDGVALEWIRSFLTDRTQQVFYQGSLSRIGRLEFGVPQGSVLGPLLFLLYTSGLFRLIENHGLVAHSYADDTQVHLSVPESDIATAVQRFTECVESIEDWMSANRLKMNADKTQVIWMGSGQRLGRIDISEITIRSSRISLSKTVSDLGVLIDGQLTMADHITSLCRSCFFQLRQIRTIKRSLTMDAKKSLVNAFVCSRLDYCNSLLYGISDGQLRRLQLVQNAAARLISGTKKYDHITPVLRILHWLPIRKRILFKIAVIVYKSLHGLAPAYLAADCVQVSTIQSRKHLRSASKFELTVPRTKSKTFAPRSFAVGGPVVWNSLPMELRVPTLTLEGFRRDLKTYLFTANC